jgi:elongator complex protein 5
MAPTTIQHRRTHNLLLISKLLSQRENVSPFTLVVDNLEQSGRPVLREYIRRATVTTRDILIVEFGELINLAGSENRGYLRFFRDFEETK